MNHVFAEPKRYRYMRLGLPGGFAYFIVIIASLVVGMSFTLAIFFLAFALLIALAIATAGLTAHRAEVTDGGLLGTTLFRTVLIPWRSVIAVELVDRRDQAFPRRLLRVGGGDAELFILDSMERFDELLELIAASARGVAISRMPLWRRLLLLQWGV